MANIRMQLRPAGYPRSLAGGPLFFASFEPTYLRGPLESGAFCGVQSTSMSESVSVSAFEDVAGVGSPWGGCCCCSCGGGAALLRPPPSVSFFDVPGSCSLLRCFFQSLDIVSMRPFSSSRHLPTEAPSQWSSGTRRPFCGDERYV
jgi:hypothetical protein